MTEGAWFRLALARLAVSKVSFSRLNFSRLRFFRRGLSGLVLTGLPLSALVLSGSGCSAPPHGGPAPWRTRTPEGEGSVSVIGRASELGLFGPSVTAGVGDFRLESRGMVATVSAENGAILDFGPRGAIDELEELRPTLVDGAAAVSLELVAIEHDGRVLHVVRRASLAPLRLHTYVTFRDRALVVESTVEAETPAADGMGISIGERLSWGNSPVFAEGAGFISNQGGSFTTQFLAHEGRHTSYALGFGGPMLVRFSPQYLAGFFSSERSATYVTAEPSGGARRSLELAATTGSFGGALEDLFGLAGFTFYTPPTDFPVGATLEIAACPTDGGARAPFAVFERGERPLAPAGCFEGRLTAPGHAPSPWASVAALGGLTLPQASALAIKVEVLGRPSPARIQVRGERGTPDPSWGLDPEEGRAVSAVHSVSGSETLVVPPGHYRVIVDRGFEYSAWMESVDVELGEPKRLSVELRREVDTTGYVSADLHLHAAPSPDAPQSLKDRVRSLVASGLEVGVATDHNRVTDYRPAVEELDAGRYLHPIIGDEVTTERAYFGHFNVFPLTPGGAPLAHELTSPAALFREARRRPPLFGETLIQLNHPRMGDIGYFDIIRFDRRDVPGFVARTPAASLDFDAIEVFNGDDATSFGALSVVLDDYRALVDAGLRVTATGNSDSHRLTFHEPGLPRTWIASNTDDPARVDDAALVRSLREGRAIVSSGPFIELFVDDHAIGDTVAPGQHRVRAIVDAASWIDVTSVYVTSGSTLLGQIDAPFPPSEHRAELEFTADLEPGEHLMAFAVGSRESEVLFRRGVIPFGFTNPIFVGPKKLDPRRR